MNKFTFLIDADSLCFYPKTIKTEIDLLSWLEFKLNKILNVCKKEFDSSATLEDFKFYISPSKNYRNAIFPEYKENRKDIVPLPFKKYLKELFKNKYNAECVEGFESDDLIADYFYNNANCVIVSLDKDLLYNITGKHINLRDLKVVETTKESAYKHFWTQFIIGDTVDNIPNLEKGLGAKTILPRLKKSGLSLKKFAIYLCEQKEVDVKIRYELLKMGNNFEHKLDEEDKVEIDLSKVRKYKLKEYYYIPFGKYVGKSWKWIYENDLQYFNWLKDKCDNPIAKSNCNRYLKSLTKWDWVDND